MSKKALILATALVVMSVPSAEAATALDVRKCIAALLKTLGTAQKCRFKVEAKFFIKADTAQRALDSEMCATKALEKRAKIVAKYGDACPSDGEPIAALGAPGTLITQLADLLVSPAFAQLDPYSVVEDPFGNIVGQIASNGLAIETASQLLTAPTDFRVRTAGYAALNPAIAQYADPPTPPTNQIDLNTQTIATTFSQKVSGDPGTYWPVYVVPVYTDAAPGIDFVQTEGGLTAIDTKTKLEWELKTTGPGLQGHFPMAYTGHCDQPPHPPCETPQDCSGLGLEICADIGSNQPVITEILARINGSSQVINTQPFAGHTDWRIPTEEELNTLKLDPCAAGVPCTRLPGSTMTDRSYWTSTIHPQIPDHQMTVWFAGSGQSSFTRLPVSPGGLYFRAVRDWTPPPP